ncbi:diol dehydratase reactivase ATPase-like domain-containing protein, partial [Salmonella enterica]
GNNKRQHLAAFKTGEQPQGNIRGTEGPRNAVATGLLLAGQAN